MKRIIFYFLLVLSWQLNAQTNSDKTDDWTNVQEYSPYDPAFDIRSDYVMVYGMDESFTKRVEEWKKHGYKIKFMTGIAWGNYQDYLYGKFDGQNHWADAQVLRSGDKMMHNDDIPYMVPTISFVDYLTVQIQKAIDLGVDEIVLEEPEFWVDCGYSESFKREWQIYYNEPWIAPHASADAQYRASKLKGYLYTRALDRLCAKLKEYSLVKYNRPVKFIVATHSLINYSQWKIVSPEARLVQLLSCDGIIAQVWTGTARTPNFYAGKKAERTFETAFLEYGVMQELVRGTGKKMWFLHDPVEDDPKHNWNDYTSNYFCTVAASLMHPEVSRYEIAPWPSRVYKGQYPKVTGDGKEGIPAAYATELMTMGYVLHDMHNYSYEMSNTIQGVGVFLSNSSMYERGLCFDHPQKTDLNKKETDSILYSQKNRQSEFEWSNFFGMAMPLMKIGVPARPVMLDLITQFNSYLDDYKILFLSYELLKPESPAIHLALANWMNNGGVIVYVGDGTDPFHNVREWWNEGKKKYAGPQQHLFETLGLGLTPAPGEYKYGKGGIIIINSNPYDIAREAAGPAIICNALKKALTMQGLQNAYTEKNYLQIKRGPYLITSVLTESVSEKPVELKGTFINLRDAGLTILQNGSVKPGENSLLYDLTSMDKNSPRILVSASRIENITQEGHSLSFVSEAPINMMVSTRLFIPGTKYTVDADDKKMEKKWDAASHTLLLRYYGNPSGTHIKITF